MTLEQLGQEPSPEHVLRADEQALLALWPCVLDQMLSTARSVPAGCARLSISFAGIRREARYLSTFDGVHLSFGSYVYFCVWLHFGDCGSSQI
eukprot:6197573-Pleurochrysis_carterae.AAC.3